MLIIMLIMMLQYVSENWNEDGDDVDDDEVINY